MARIGRSDLHDDWSPVKLLDLLSRIHPAMPHMLDAFVVPEDGISAQQGPDTAARLEAFAAVVVEATGWSVSNNDRAAAIAAVAAKYPDWDLAEEADATNELLDALQPEGAEPLDEMAKPEFRRAARAALDAAMPTTRAARARPDRDVLDVEIIAIYWLLTRRARAGQATTVKPANQSSGADNLVRVSLVTSWGDSFPAWLGGIGGILSVVVALYALLRAIRSERRHVEWQKTITEQVEEGKRPHAFALVNGTSGVSAYVTAVEDVSDGLRDAVRNDLRLPETVDPGGSIPLHIDRSLASAYPTIIKISWREGQPHSSRRGRRIYTSTFYFD